MYYTQYVTCIFVTLYKIRAKRPNQKPKRIQCCSPPPPLKKKKSSISFLLPGLFIKLMQGYFLGEKYYYYIYCVLELHTLCVFYKIRLSASSDFCQTSGVVMEKWVFKARSNICINYRSRTIVGQQLLLWLLSTIRTLS